jgi:hypothetical protein
MLKIIIIPHKYLQMLVKKKKAVALINLKKTIKVAQ